MLFITVTMATGGWPLLVLLLAMMKMLIVSSLISTYRQHSTVSLRENRHPKMGSMGAAPPKCVLPQNLNKRLVAIVILRYAYWRKQLPFFRKSSSAPKYCGWLSCCNMQICFPKWTAAYRAIIISQKHHQQLLTGQHTCPLRILFTLRFTNASSVWFDRKLDSFSRF